jgi:hypothetical protein
MPIRTGTSAGWPCALLIGKVVWLNFRESQYLHYRWAKWGGEDDIRAGISAELCELQDFH